MSDPNKLSTDEVEARVNAAVNELLARAALHPEADPSDGTFAYLDRLVAEDPEALEAYKGAVRKRLTGQI
jgi:hypothetical protein